MERSHPGIIRGKLSIVPHLNLFTVFVILSLLAVGCAAPGEPIARQPAVAPGINDLAAKQTGSAVVLTFSLPKRTTQGDPLPKAPEIEIYRNFLPAQVGGTASAAQPATPNQLILTVTPQMEAQYRSANRLHIPAPLAESDISANAGEYAVYMVRTRISSRDSADSNVAEALILPPPSPVEDLHVHVTKSAIELSWMAIRAPSANALKPTAIRYRVYRAQAASAASSGGETANAQQITFAPEFALLGETETPSFSDANFSFGLTYVYMVRSVARYEAAEIESDDSAHQIVTPRDTFPPTAPTGLVVASVPALNGEPAYVVLSWDISVETDVTGYNVYRSEEESDIGKRVNSQLLPAPTFRDTSVETGHRYFYRVTAMSRSGNESAPSAAVAVTLPATSEHTNGAGGARQPQ